MDRRDFIKTSGIAVSTAAMPGIIRAEISGEAEAKKNQWMQCRHKEQAMIIDVHYHQIPVLPDGIIKGTVSDLIQYYRSPVQDQDMEELCQKAKNIWPDPDGSKLIAGMDEAGVDFTLICALDNAESPLITAELASLQNKIVAGIAQKHPDRVMALAGVDPRRPAATDLLKQCLEEFGMKGLKYHPDFGYNPAGPESYQLLEMVQAHNGILLTHTGPLPPPARAKFAEPDLLADIAVDFPELKVIAAHMGRINWRPWASLAAVQKNLYGDLAMWDAIAFDKYPLFCRELRDLIDLAGIDKVLFGTDDPIHRIIRPTRDWIKLIKNLPKKAPPGIKFTKQEVDAILGKNAARILGLKQDIAARDSSSAP